MSTPAPKAKAKARAGRPSRVSRPEIVAVARRILAEDGLAALSMRRVAKELGVAPMTLYNHVEDKDDLLLGVIYEFASDWVRPELPEQPRERLIAVVLYMHDRLAERPWMVEVLLAGDLVGHYALWMTETIISSAVECGLSTEAAVLAYRSLWHYVVGELMTTIAADRRSADSDRPHYFAGLLAGLDPATHPTLAALGPGYLEITRGYDFAVGVRAFVDGLLRGTQDG